MATSIPLLPLTTPLKCTLETHRSQFSCKPSTRRIPVCHSSCNDTTVTSSRFGQKAAAVAASALLMIGGLNAPVAMADEGFVTYYGTAASASSYGGYGGNSNKKDSAEYTYEVPDGWKERNISKVEKGTNGTDSEFFNPKKRKEKTYLTFLAGFRRLPPQDNVLTNIALSDVNLQDQIASADSIDISTHEIDGQKYYDFEIDSPLGHNLISVTCTRNKLYAHFVSAPPGDWEREESLIRHVHESFKTT